MVAKCAIVSGSQLSNVRLEDLSSIIAPGLKTSEYHQRCAGSRFPRQRSPSWVSDEQKAQTVAESFQPGIKACSVARRHGLAPQQLFTWRWLARKPLEAAPNLQGGPMFVPAVVEAGRLCPVI
ncbi:transposase [Neorhizobium sp. 2083]|uniref:transposase n=1 Tax=Neorhizobium sp. 2083 TaxID=2817762 RepID=UPI0038620BB7